MSMNPSYAAPALRFLCSAWGCSIFFHLAAIALIASSMQPTRHGAGDGGNSSISIVLNHSDEPGDLRNGDNGEGEIPRTRPELAEAPPLLAMPPAELPPPVPTPNEREVASAMAATRP